MTAPVVSIVMPTFDRLHFLRPAVESVFTQTFHDWELIIADDGSTLATRAFLETLRSDPRVRAIHLPHSGNPAKVRNAALDVARGQYVAFLDSDDIWLPAKLEKQIELQHAAGAGRWSYTLFDLIDGNGETLPAADREWPAAEGNILQALIKREAIIALPAVMVPRDLLRQVGGFDEEQSSCEDYDLWLRLAAVSEAVVVRQRLVRVRRHREHSLGDVETFEGLRRALGKARDAPACSELRAVLDVQCARVAAGHARSCAAAADRVGAWQVAVRSLPRGWRFRVWWSGVVLALAQASAPRGVWNALRDWRRRRRAGMQPLDAR